MFLNMISLVILSNVVSITEVKLTSLFFSVTFKKNLVTLATFQPLRTDELGMEQVEMKTFFLYFLKVLRTTYFLLFLA